jgi:hypothetical protein
MKDARRAGAWRAAQTLRRSRKRASSPTSLVLSPSISACSDRSPASYLAAQGQWAGPTRDDQAFEERIAETERRRAEILTDLAELNRELAAEPERHNAAVADWLAAGSEGERPASRASELERRIADLRAEPGTGRRLPASTTLIGWKSGVTSSSKRTTSASHRPRTICRRPSPCAPTSSRTRGCSCSHAGSHVRHDATTWPTGRTTTWPTTIQPPPTTGDCEAPAALPQLSHPQTLGGVGGLPWNARTGDPCASRQISHSVAEEKNGGGVAFAMADFLAGLRLNPSERVLGALALEVADALAETPAYAKGRLARELREIIGELARAEVRPENLSVLDGIEL